jgi:flagella basal body P-ring formation protein FlgA
MKLILSLILAAASAWANGCIVVDREAILARDLAAADPVFASLDPTLRIAASPLPGVRRTISIAELGRLARANGIPLPVSSEICFERATTTLSPDELLPVLQKALNIEGAQIKILDFVRVPVPRGTPEFLRTGLNANGLWRGHIQYEQNRSVPVWVKVQVTAEQVWLEAAAPLVPGKPIAPDQVIVREGPRFPFGPVPLSSTNLAEGRMPLRRIAPGEPIFAAMLTTPPDIRRGEKVTVDAISGDAHISFDALAESSGRTGESVLVRNPENGRYFRAHVDGVGKVSVSR